jgi:hypothetical protein
LVPACEGPQPSKPITGHRSSNPSLEGARSPSVALIDGNWVELIGLQGGAFMIDCMENYST